MKTVQTKLSRVDNEDFDASLIVECDKQQSHSAATLFPASSLPSSGGTVTCVTLYNEIGDELRQSLIALARTISNHCNNATSALQAKKQILQPHTIAVIADGVGNLSTTARQLLFDIGFPDFQATQINADMRIYYQHISARKLFAILNPNEAYELSIADYLIPFFICIKKSNAGKLDSHWWYYRFLCPLLQPAYCFQMDVGTLPSLESFHHMVSYFSTHPSCAALASNVAVAAPDANFDPLQIWQYCSFQQGLLLEWPAEECSGYLSVIPGQYSGMRWRALRDSADSNNESLAVDIDYEPSPWTLKQLTSDASEKVEPLDIYFRGLGALEPHEAIVYLAEDRVLCNEVAFRNQGRWRLEYIDSAEATTDACKSLEELLRQRRRWYGSYIACRIKFINRLKTSFKNSDTTPQEFVRLACAGVYQTIQLLFDWFFPALLLLSYFCIDALVKQHSNAPFITLFSTLGLMMSSIIATQFLFCLRGKLDKIALRIFQISIVIQSIYLVSAAVIFILHFFDDNFLVLRWPFILLLFSLPLAALSKGSAHFFPIFKYFLPYSALRPAFALLFWMYAICNAHDNSWGTKGLQKPKYSTIKSDGRTARKNYINFRNRFVALWIISNMAILLSMWIGFAQLHGLLLSLIINMLAGNVIFSLAALLYKKYFSKQSVRTPMLDSFKSSSH